MVHQRSNSRVENCRVKTHAKPWATVVYLFSNRKQRLYTYFRLSFLFGRGDHQQIHLPLVLASLSFARATRLWFKCPLNVSFAGCMRKYWAQPHCNRPHIKRRTSIARGCLTDVFYFFSARVTSLISLSWRRSLRCTWIRGVSLHFLRKSFSLLPSFLLLSTLLQKRCGTDGPRIWPVTPFLMVQ